MTMASHVRRWLRYACGSAGALMLAGGCWWAAASAQEPDLPESPPPPAVKEAAEPPAVLPDAALLPDSSNPKAPASEQSSSMKEDKDVQPAGCSSCGHGRHRSRATDCSPCGGGRDLCIPGRERDCDCEFGDHVFGRLIAGLYECLCCPDPCYEPLWLPAADSGFWIDAARPKSHMKLYFNKVWDFSNPDAAEWFWARVGGKGPTRNGNGPVGNVDMTELRMYTETGADKFSAFIDYGYRRTDPEFFTGHGGFSDLIVGTKSLLFDCELMQLTFQFKTYIPTGAAGSGLGTGHVALEPALLANLRLAEDFYLQSQFAYWIPIGGTGGHQGSVFHYHFSLNKVVWKPCHDLQLVAVGEMGGFHIGDGEYTPDTTVGQLPAKDVGDIFYLAPGLRLFVCEQFDVGASFNFAVTDDNFGDKALRVEFRWRY